MPKICCRNSNCRTQINFQGFFLIVDGRYYCSEACADEYFKAVSQFVSMVDPKQLGVATHWILARGFFFDKINISLYTKKVHVTRKDSHMFEQLEFDFGETTTDKELHYDPGDFFSDDVDPKSR